VVILESALGDFAPAWAYVHYKIASTTRTCAYDRAGLGFSDEGPMPRDAAAMASDLHAMLKASGLRGPYVFVGHSVASYYLRLFADLHPMDVAGMVLVDPSGDRQSKRMDAVSPGYSNPRPYIARASKCGALAEAAKLGAGTEGYRVCIGAPPPLPADVVAARLAEYQSPAMYREVVSEYENLDQDSDEVVAARRSYGDMPLVVLTGAETQKEPPSSDAVVRARAKVWNQMHDEIAALSSRGQNRLVEGSGHYIQYQRPQVVIDTVKEVVTEVRRRR
jgi:pimeloyl-ACP methyl ester carboxylesterase